MKNAIMFIGEGWGEKEEELGRPFVGPPGYLLDQLLSQVGIARRECYLTNVFNFRVNDVANLCGPRPEGIPGTPSLVKGKFVRREYLPELARLYGEINDVNPNLIVALGSTAAWAVSGSSGIKTIRGSALLASGLAGVAAGTPLRRGYKTLPTYHPAAVLREYTLRPILLADLDKARRYSETPVLVRPKRELWIAPTLDDLARYDREFIQPAARLSIDIETKGDIITCVGFAPSPSSAIVVPFWSDKSPGHNYWPTSSEEEIALSYVRRWCETKPSVFQNGLYDMHRLYRQYGVRCYGQSDDTMLLHHTLQPEMEKGLGFLGSCYTDESSWKFMRKLTDTKKKEA